MYEYTAKIIQQPKTGRECGLTKPFFKTCLLPVLVIQVQFIEGKTIEELTSYNLVCHLILKGSEGFQTVLINSVHSLRRYNTNIFGPSTMHGQILTDPITQTPQIYFVFPEIYIKSPGTLNVPPIVVNTNDFEIYSLHDFKKSADNSIITRSFEKQGVNMKNRKLKELD
ncbi:hypothetical protein HDV04_000586 [Boothiomyces sp. JEL0838]|nr:hypothetical protein HDV04_000586 [Boothiomyces sp. JEL0838]